jgi:hypothetical protein
MQISRDGIDTQKARPTGSPGATVWAGGMAAGTGRGTHAVASPSANGLAPPALARLREAAASDGRAQA